MFTRRTATVTISAPDASCACAITANDEYLPVPTINRDLKVRPAITNGASVNAQLPTNHESLIANHQCSLAAAYEVHDLHGVAVADDDFSKPMALDDVQVVFHRNATRIDLEPGQEGRDRHRLVELDAF